LQAAIDVLAASGIDDPDAPVTQHLSADLEGDGVAEDVLIVNNVPDDLFGSAGVYSLAMRDEVAETRVDVATSSPRSIRRHSHQQPPPPGQGHR
jgi:hypothetical protein